MKKSDIRVGIGALNDRPENLNLCPQLREHLQSNDITISFSILEADYDDILNVYYVHDNNSLCYYQEAYVKKCATVLDNDNVRILNGIETFINAGIIPKLIINDELKDYLLHNRAIQKNSDGTYTVEFGNYIGVRFHDYANICNRKNKTDKYIELWHSTSLIYEYHNQEYVLDEGSLIRRIEPVKWHLDLNKNELVATSLCIGVHYPIRKHVSDTLKIENEDIKVEDTIFYKEFLSTTFLRELLKSETIFEKEDEYD